MEYLEVVKCEGDGTPMKVVCKDGHRTICEDKNGIKYETFGGTYRSN